MVAKLFRNPRALSSTLAVLRQGPLYLDGLVTLVLVSNYRIAPNFCGKKLCDFLNYVIFRDKTFVKSVGYSSLPRVYLNICE